MNTPKDRFYDKEPVVSATVEIINALPPDMQGIIAKGLNLIAIKDFQVDNRMANLKSVGPELIMTLYKSKQKRREYDVNADFHNAINYLRLLEPEERLEVSIQVLDIARCADQYLVACAGTEVSSETRQKEVKRIRDTYVQTGAEAARNFVAAICEELSLQRKRAPITGIDAGSRIKPNAPMP